jgi:DNA invertase Pin-like site-specific DNA recombinase
MTMLGYVRVSTSKQTNDQQVDALVQAGVDPSKIWSDVRSGTRSDREGLTNLLAYAREGDTLVVVALDRLARSLSHSVRLIEELRERGIYLRSLREGIDLSTSAGRFQAAIFQALAELEADLIKERAQAAREAAKARGRLVGRPPAITQDQAETARTMRAAGIDVTTIARTLNTSRATIYRYTESAA